MVVFWFYLYICIIYKWKREENSLEDAVAVAVIDVAGVVAVAVAGLAVAGLAVAGLAVAGLEVDEVRHHPFWNRLWRVGICAEDEARLLVCKTINNTL